MAPAGALDCLAKRDLLASDKASPDKLKAQAQVCVQAGMTYDALRYRSAAGETREVERMAQEAVGAGDLFLYLQALRELGRKPDPAQLSQLAQAAESRGYSSFAEQARNLAAPDGTQTDG